MFRFLDKWRYDRILHAFCINPYLTMGFVGLRLILVQDGVYVGLCILEGLGLALTRGLTLGLCLGTSGTPINERACAQDKECHAMGKIAYAPKIPLTDKSRHTLLYLALWQSTPCCGEFPDKWGRCYLIEPFDRLEQLEAFIEYLFGVGELAFELGCLDGVRWENSSLYQEPQSPGYVGGSPISTEKFYTVDDRSSYATKSNRTVIVWHLASS
jgi:hypothetical protein